MLHRTTTRPLAFALLLVVAVATLLVGSVSGPAPAVAASEDWGAHRRPGPGPEERMQQLPVSLPGHPPAR